MATPSPDPRLILQVAVVDALVLAAAVGSWLMGWTVLAIVLFALSFLGTPLVIIAMTLNSRR